MLNIYLETVLVVLLSVMTIGICIGMIYLFAELILEVYNIVTKNHYDIDDLIERAFKRIRA